MDMDESRIAKCPHSSRFTHFMAKLLKSNDIQQKKAVARCGPQPHNK